MRLLTTALAISLLLASPASHAEDTGIVGGIYDDGMMIGYDPVTRTVSGYYASTTGEGQFSCIFYLTGKLSGAEAPIATYFPEHPKTDRIDGKLVIDGVKSFRVTLPEEHGGCWNVQRFADDSQPAEFALDDAHPWTSMAVIKSEKAYFYDAPDGVHHRKAYVVKGDGVGVRAARAGWLDVDFVSGGKTVSGWIKLSDVYPAR